MLIIYLYTFYILRNITLPLLLRNSRQTLQNLKPKTPWCRAVTKRAGGYNECCGAGLQRPEMVVSQRRGLGFRGNINPVFYNPYSRDLAKKRSQL